MMLTDGSSKVTKLVLGERTGFVRLAITHGMSLVPGFCFGEKWVHESILLPKPVRAFLYKRFKVAGQLLRGRFYCTFLGHVVRADGITPLTLGYAWGVPIDVRHEPNPKKWTDTGAQPAGAVRRVLGLLGVPVRRPRREGLALLLLAALLELI